MTQVRGSAGSDAELDALRAEVAELRLRVRELERADDALRQSQQSLIQQERLRALAQMSSGMAHDSARAILRHPEQGELFSS